MIFLENELEFIDEQEWTDYDTDYDVEYRKSVAFDLEKGDFILDGSNRMLVCDGIEAFKMWCYKMAITQRYSCIAYDDEIGTELEESTSAQEQEVIELELERAITEALLVNPRTEYVRDFSFVWNADEVVCTFVVKGIELEEEFEITI